MEEDEVTQAPVEGPTLPPRVEGPETVPQNPFLEGVPLSAPEGAGRQAQREAEEAAQLPLWQRGDSVGTLTIRQSVLNSAIEYLQTTPQAVEELLTSGTAELEPYRAELTKDIPLHLQDNVMSSMTYAGALARRDRILQDQREQARLAQQVGISRGAMQLAAGLIDADLPLILASGGTIAAARTAASVARTARALTGSTTVARVAGDAAVGVTGGALSGAVVGGIGNIVRDDYDISGMFQMIVAGAATGGVLNPAIGTVGLDRQVWGEAARMEMTDALRRFETDLQRDLMDPESAINRNTTPLSEADQASNPVPRGPVLVEADDLADDVATPMFADQTAPNTNGFFDEEQVLYESDNLSVYATGVGIDGLEFHRIELSDGTILNAEVRRNGDELEIQNIYNDENMFPSNEDFNKVGFSQIRQLSRAYGEMDPNLQYISGNRVGGARHSGEYVGSDLTAIPARVRIPRVKREDASDAGSVGARNLGTSPSAINVDQELANLDANRAAAPGSTPLPVHPWVQDMADAGATERAIRRSVANREWEIDYDYDRLYQEDTKNPWVRTLVGDMDYEVKIPFTNRSVNLGQIAGTVFTLGQRDFTNLVRSKSPGARFVAAQILSSASGLVRRGSSAAVLKEIYQGSAMVHSAEAIVNQRSSYFRKKGLNSWRVESHRQFSRDLRLAMHDYYMTGKVDPEFKDLIDSIDKTHMEILDRMKGIDEDRSVRGAREIDHRPGYFRYDWEPRNFLRVRQQVGEEGMIQAFRDGYMRGSGLDADLATRLAKAIVRRFSDRGLGVGAADSRLLDIDSRSGIEAVLEQSGLSRADVDSIMRRLDVNTQERATKGYLRRRTDVDMRTPIPGTNLKLVDLLSDDIERSLREYVGDAAGAAALANKGIRDKADLEALKDTILFEQSALREQGLERGQLDAIFSQFTGGVHKGFLMGRETSGVSPLTSMLTKATRASLLQRVGLTQLMDTANLFVANGVQNVMEPVMARLGWNRPGAMTKAEYNNLYDELQSLGVIVGQDQMLFRPHLSIDETELANNVYMQMGQSALNSVERATNYASGQIHVTAAQQMVSAAAVTTNVLRALAGQETNLTNRMLRDIGLEPDKISDLVDLIRSGVIEVDGGKVKLNSSQWSAHMGEEQAAELANEFGAAIFLAVNQQVQRSLIGETSVWMNSDIGKLLTSLKTFALTAVQKQTARNLMIGGRPYFLQAATWQLGFAYAVLTLGQTVQGQEMSATDRARLAVAYSATLGVAPMVVDPITTMLGFDDLNFSPYGRYTSYLDTPVFDQTQKLMQAPGAIGGMLSGDGDYNDMQNARAMFFMNWYGMKQVWEAMR